jgi:hypothetical protein
MRTNATIFLVLLMPLGVTQAQAPKAGARTGAERARAEALAEPFRGITTNGTVERGLFAIKSTGVSTEPVRQGGAGVSGGPHAGAACEDEVSG